VKEPMAQRTCCDREIEVHEALVLGWWPDRADDELRAHVAGCPSCRDLVSVAGAVRRELEAATSESHVPPARIVWLRAHLREREEAVRRATRPIAIAHAVAIAVTAVVAWEALRRTAAWVWDTRDSLGAGLSKAGAFLSSAGAYVSAGVASGSTLWLIPLVAVGAAVALTPVAIYLAVSEK